MISSNDNDRAIDSLPLTLGLSGLCIPNKEGPCAGLCLLLIMPKVTRSSDVAGTADPAKAPARTKKKKDKPPATDPSTWPESQIDAKERVSEVFPAMIKLRNYE